MLLAGALFLFIAGPKKGNQEKNSVSEKGHTKPLIENSKVSDSQSEST
jgi:hypothetical protein